VATDLGKKVSHLFGATILAARKLIEFSETTSVKGHFLNYLQEKFPILLGRLAQ